MEDNIWDFFNNMLCWKLKMKSGYSISVEYDYQYE